MFRLNKRKHEKSGNDDTSPTTAADQSTLFTTTSVLGEPNRERNNNIDYNILRLHLDMLKKRSLQIGHNQQQSFTTQRNKKINQMFLDSQLQNGNYDQEMPSEFYYKNPPDIIVEPVPGKLPSPTWLDKPRKPFGLTEEFATMSLAFLLCLMVVVLILKYKEYKRKQVKQHPKYLYGINDDV